MKYFIVKMTKKEIEELTNISTVKRRGVSTNKTKYKIVFKVDDKNFAKKLSDMSLEEIKQVHENSFKMNITNFKKLINSKMFDDGVVLNRCKAIGNYWVFSPKEKEFTLYYGIKNEITVRADDGSVFMLERDFRESLEKALKEVDKLFEAVGQEGITWLYCFEDMSVFEKLKKEIKECVF